jgi:hypothetical protein
MVTVKLPVFFIIGIILAPLLLNAAQNRGAEDMLLFGGNKGDVAFPHRIHQVAIGDCDQCHNLFSQTKGSIEELKANKRLEKKQVMKECRNCHKSKKTGEKTGPTGCKACHGK